MRPTGGRKAKKLAEKLIFKIAIKQNHFLVPVHLYDSCHVDYR